MQINIFFLSGSHFNFTSGCPVGNILAIPITGMLAKYGFDGGWPSVFYCFGKLYKAGYPPPRCYHDVFLNHKPYLNPNIKTMFSYI